MFGKITVKKCFVSERNDFVLLGIKIKREKRVKKIIEKLREIMEQVVMPKRIVKAEKIENAESVLLKKDLQIDLFASDFLTVKEDGGFLTLDFGLEMNGGIRILTQDVDNGGSADIRIRFGESLSEANAELGEKNATNDHSPRDIVRKIVFASDLTFGETGYRFVRIDFQKGHRINIKAIVGTNTILRKRLKRGYCGKDGEIGRIFDTAKRTVDLCASGKYIWDGIKRDRLVWSGDLYPEILSLTYLYGRVKQIENSLDFERTRAKYEGKWISPITTYSMWWVACVAEYRFLTGSEAFIKRQLPYIRTIIDDFNEIVDDDGKMHYNMNFVDWPTENTPDEEVGARMISIFAVKKALRLFEEFGENTDAPKRLLGKLLKGDMTVKEQKQVLGLKYFALGEITDREYELLIKDGACGFSTFMSYFILSAIASKNRSLAVKLMKDYYGAMLDKGATTFWEDFDMDWIVGSGRIDTEIRPGEKDIHGDFGKYCYRGFRHSLCHAWSSGVIKFIAENCE